MKYDKSKYKEYIESKLLSIFYSLDISEDRLDTITMQEIREIVDQTYPILSSGSEESREIKSTRNKILALATESMYYYNLIKKREQ
jgi:hypothetical protein